VGLRLKLDEHLPRMAVRLLADAGHDAHTVEQEGLEGSPDADLIAACTRENRILVTLDLDFTDIRRYPPGSNPGVWVLRPERQSIDRTLQTLRTALALLDTEAPARRLWIVEAGRVRIRE
jgi:predicted nuclease of predicted toxin-antitoxin system